MQRSVKSLLFIFAALVALFATGCIDKTVYPATELQVTSVEPYALIPTATDTASLPTTTITVKSQSKIPCSLKSISARYFTVHGEEIPLLAISRQEIQTSLDAEGEATIELGPYSSALLDLFELSASKISPVKAQITMHFLDINGNWVNLEAHCLLYKYDAAATTGSRRSL